MRKYKQRNTNRAWEMYTLPENTTCTLGAAFIRFCADTSTEHPARLWFRLMANRHARQMLLDFWAEGDCEGLALAAELWCIALEQTEH